MKRMSALLLAGLYLCAVLSGCAPKEEIPASVTAVLQTLGAEDPAVLRDGKVEDNLVSDPAMTITWGGGSYALLNTAGDIVRIKRTQEWRNGNRPAAASNFETVDDLIAYIEENLIGPGYELVQEYNFSQDTLSLRYEKILFPGALDQYDYVSVLIRTQEIAVETFFRQTSGFQPEEGKTVVDRETAIAVASSLLGEDIRDVRLTTVKPNDYFGSSAAEDALCLAYIVSVENKLVYVDAYTAQVIGGDAYK